MFFAKEETLSRAEMEKIQLERLKETVSRVYEKVLPYRKKMDEAGIKPEDIKSLDDLKRLPFVTKQDMRDNYPFGLFAVPKGDLVRIHASSGTTGKRVVAFYTQHDIDLWEDCCARALVAAGATKSDVCQVAYGYGLFTGGLGAHYGAEKLGAMVVPMSVGNTKKLTTMITT